MKKSLLLFVIIITAFLLVACETDTPKSEKYCWSCGGGITKQAVFCEHCGISLKENSTEATSKESTTEESAKPETSICNHSWKNATCTAPRTCEKCGLTEGKANGHWWYEATCTDARMCTVCLAEDQDSKPLGHSFIQGKCERCGEDNPNSVDKIIETITVSKSSLTIDKSTTISVGVTYRESDYPEGIVLDATYDSNIVEIEWGEWDEQTIPLTIIPIQDGTATIKISISENENIFKNISVTVNKNGAIADSTTNYNENEYYELAQDAYDYVKTQVIYPHTISFTHAVAGFLSDGRPAVEFSYFHLNAYGKNEWEIKYYTYTDSGKISCFDHMNGFYEFSSSYYLDIDKIVH